jgi:hypothetical protein
MPLISENFGNLLEPGLRKVFAQVFLRQNSMLPTLFNMQTSDKAVEHDLSMGDTSDLEEFTGSIPYDDQGESYKTDYEHKEYVRGIKIERKLVLNDLYSQINRKPQGLALGAFRRKEKDGASVFNNATSAVVLGGDAVALGSSAHPSKNGGANQSNLLTDALSPTAVETARQTMIAFKTDRDNETTVIPDMILVPHQLEETAWEIINSKGKVDTAQNNANFHQGKYKLAVWNNFLTSATRWFMIDSELMKMFLNWFDREPLEFFKDQNFDVLMAKYAAHAHYSFGWSDWRWVLVENA